MSDQPDFAALTAGAQKVTRDLEELNARLADLTTSIQNALAPEWAERLVVETELFLAIEHSE